MAACCKPLPCREKTFSVWVAGLCKKKTTKKHHDHFGMCENEYRAHFYNKRNNFLLFVLILDCTGICVPLGALNLSRRSNVGSACVLDRAAKASAR